MFKIKFLIILLLMFILGCSNEKNELSEKLYSKNIEIKNVHVTNNSTKVSYDETQGHIILDLNREDNPDTNWNENQYSNLFLDFNVGINDLEKKNSLRENVEKYLKNNKSDETIIEHSLNNSSLFSGKMTFLTLEPILDKKNKVDWIVSPSSLREK